MEGRTSQGPAAAAPSDKPPTGPGWGGAAAEGPPPPARSARNGRRSAEAGYRTAPPEPPMMSVKLQPLPDRALPTQPPALASPPPGGPLPNLDSPRAPPAPEQARPRSGSSPNPGPVWHPLPRGDPEACAGDPPRLGGALKKVLGNREHVEAQRDQALQDLQAKIQEIEQALAGPECSDAQRYALKRKVALLKAQSTRQKREFGAILQQL